MTMIKNAIVLKALLPDTSLLRQQLDQMENGHIAETEFRRDAFIPTQDEGLVAEFPSGFKICLRHEEKIIPRGAIQAEALKRAGEIAEERGEELTSEELEGLVTDVGMQMCKQAFVKTTHISAFYHIQSELLFITTTSPGDVERFMNALLKATGKIQTVTIHISGVKNGITSRLKKLIEYDFDPDDPEDKPFGMLDADDMVKIRLKAPADEPAEVITYRGGYLANSRELLNQLERGFKVEEIGLTYPDAGMSFRLTHQFRFKGIRFDEKEPSEPEQDSDDGQHFWRIKAMLEVESMVEAVNELCSLMDYEQPVFDDQDDVADQIDEEAGTHE